MDDTIWIQHWDDLEDKLAPQHLCIGVVTGQVAKESPHHPAGVGLPWVHSARYHHILLVYLRNFVIIYKMNLNQ